ncbi:hemin uptake protein HemP [Polynucleobacter sp. MWH-Mekk-B1]|jgi:hemin uptake protein HemP|nr:hemin uptake protein HemP [Polynucleobacter finlandensis]
MIEKNISSSESKLNQSAPEMPKTVLSDTLLGPGKLVFILHDGHRYQLRVTKLRKLILTK